MLRRLHHVTRAPPCPTLPRPAPSHSVCLSQCPSKVPTESRRPIRRRCTGRGSRCTTGRWGRWGEASSFWTHHWRAATQRYTPPRTHRTAGAKQTNKRSLKLYFILNNCFYYHKDTMCNYDYYTQICNKCSNNKVMNNNNNKVMNNNNNKVMTALSLSLKII